MDTNQAARSLWYLTSSQPLSASASIRWSASFLTLSRIGHESLMIRTLSHCTFNNCQTWHDVITSTTSTLLWYSFQFLRIWYDSIAGQRQTTSSGVSRTICTSSTGLWNTGFFFQASPAGIFMKIVEVQEIYCTLSRVCVFVIVCSLSITLSSSIFVARNICKIVGPLLAIYLRLGAIQKRIRHLTNEVFTLCLRKIGGVIIFLFEIGWTE